MQFSIISKNNLERTFRIDAEFYKLEVLNSLSLLSKKKLLTNYVKVSDGNHLKISEYFQDYPGIPYYRGKDINNDFFLENARPVYIPEKKYNEKQMRRSHFLPGDVLLSILGTIGSLSLVTDAQKSTGSCKIAILRPISELSSEYIASFLRSNYGQIQLKRIVRGTVQKWTLLEDLEQIQIHPCSNKFNQMIKETVQLSIKLNNLRKKQYYKAEKILLNTLDLNEFQPQHKLSFTKKFLEIEQVERYDAEYFQPKFNEIIKRINKYKNGYKHLEDLTSVVGHPANPPYGTSDDAKEKTFIITQKHLGEYFPIDDFWNDQESLYTTDEFIVKNKKYMLCKNDIILYSVGAEYIGKANLYNSPIRATFGSFLTLIRPIQQLINPFYLLVFLNSSIGQLLTKRNLRGSIQQYIYPHDTKKVPIPMLDKSIQEQIEITIREGEEAFSKSKDLLNISKKAVEIAIEINEEKAIVFIDSELQKLK